MRDRHAVIERGLGGAERTRRVALDDQQGRRIGEVPVHSPAHPRDMGVGLRQAGAVERDLRPAATGESLTASGLVPTTSQISALRSLPPSSAGEMCLRYG